MEKKKPGQQILRRTVKMPAAAAGAASALNTEEVVATASSPVGSSVAVDGSPSRPSSPAAETTASSTAAAAAASAAAASLPVSETHSKYHYTRDELLSLKNSSLSKIKPEFLTPVHELFEICVEVDSAMSVPSRNAFDEQTSLRPGNPSKRHLSLGEQRSSVSQLNDDCDADVHISLVPQRSSFGTGCHVVPGRTVNSPEAKRERNRRDGHRIGSGRIQISEKYADRELHDHRTLCDRERDRSDRWYDRCGNSTKMIKRDYDGRRSEAYREGRYLGDSTRSAAEPEWFTEGPLSQSDTIELRGFECPQKSNSASKEHLGSSSAVAGRGDQPKPQQPNSLPKTAQDVVMETVTMPPESRDEECGVFSDTAEAKKERRGGGGGAIEEDQSIVSVVTGSAHPLLPASGKDSSPQPAAVPSTLPPSDPLPHGSNELDFNTFFNVDSIPGLNELFSLEPEQAKCGSRFQQWFHLSSHGNSHCESRRSSLTDEFGYINDIIYGHNSPLGQMSPPPPNPPPPPPAAHAALFGSRSSAFSAEKYSDETQNLLEMLQKANADGYIGTVPFNDPRDARASAAASAHGVTSAAAAAAAENASMNYCLSNQGCGRTDARDVEAGLKAILSGAILGNSLLSGLSPSMAASLAVAGPPPPPPLPPPSGAKVLLAEELEARLVAAGSQVPADPDGGQGHQRYTQDIYRMTPGNSHRLVSPWSNSGTLSFCSLPVLPVGTKVTLLSDLEAGLKGLNVVNGNRGIINSASQPVLGSANDCRSNSLPPSTTGRPVSSLDDDEMAVGQLMSSSAGGNAFVGQAPNDLVAYKKLLGLIVEPHGSQAASNTSLPIVTSPTSVSMSSLEANQPNNSLANNQRDFIQRYLLQQQQLKMLHHHPHQQPPPPPPPEGGVFAPPPSGLPQHLLPPDLPQSYLSPGMHGDPVPPSGGLLIAPPGRTTVVSPDFVLTSVGHGGGSCGYGRSSLGPPLNLTTPDDLALVPGLSAEFCGPFPPSQVQGGQMHLAATRGRYTGSHMHHGGLLSPQRQETTMIAPIGQPLSSQSRHQMLLQESAKHVMHQASVQQQHHQQQQQHQQQQHQQQQLQHQQQQQQMVKMTHLALHDQFTNSMKPRPGPLSPHPVPMPPQLTLQPPSVSSHPSPAGLSMFSHQSLLQQPPQSPRRAASPIMFGNQPPVNLTAPLPVHLGPMTPILSPTLSPNTLQVAQTGSNLSSPVMRVPSPQELSGLAQSILQNALIKKQLEEQKERFIKRQQERNKSPKPQVSSSAAVTTAPKAASTVAPSVLTAASALESGRVTQSFLPTSVLRKMASSKADERTRLADSLSCSGEKNVPVLKVVKPDEDGTEDDDNENKGNLAPINNSSSSSCSLQCHGSSQHFFADDRVSEISVKSSMTGENAVIRAVPPSAASASLPQTLEISSTGAKRLSLQAVASVPSSVAEMGLQSQASTRRLLGQGLMNIGSSASGAVVQLPPNQSLPVNPLAGPAIHPNSMAAAAAAAAGFISSGRQIKGKKMPEHLFLSCSVPAANRSKPSDYHHQVQQQQQHQQQQQQQQFFPGGSSNSRSAVLNLHALEMAKLLEQQRKGVPSSVMPPVPPPVMAPQFVSAGTENGAYGVAPLPRMLVHPTFGGNCPAAAAAVSNALMLQRLAYPSLHRGGLPSVNHLNLNQLALMQAVQLQAQQQQQQQQQLWNRNAVRNLNNQDPFPAFATSSLPPRSAAAAPGTFSNKPAGTGGGPGVSGGTGLKTTPVSNADSIQMKRDSEVFTPGTTNLHQHLNDVASRSSEVSGLAPGTEAVSQVTTSAEDEQGGNHHQASCRSDMASDVGNLAKWFGSDVFNHHLPPFVAAAGQKVLTVDEIESWQRAVGES